MSGQPLQNPMDSSKFRTQYMGYLNQQIKNDSMNLEANKIFKKTGQTPTQMTDNRTTTEKYADIERAKTELYKDLLQLMDGQQATDVLEWLDGWRADGWGIMFALRSFPFALQSLKPKNKFGMMSQDYIGWIQAYEAKERATEGVDFGIQEATGRNMLIGIQDIQRDMLNQESLRGINDALGMAGVALGTSNALVRAVRDDLQNLRRVIPDEATLQRIMLIPNADLRAEITADLNEALKDMPTKMDIQQILAQLDQRRGDPKALEQTLDRLHQMLAQEPATQEMIQLLEQHILEAVRGEAVGRIPGVVGGVFYISPEILDTISGAKLTGYIGDINALDPMIIPRNSGTTYNVFNTWTKGEKVRFLVSKDNQIRALFHLPDLSRGEKMGSSGGASPVSAGTTMSDMTAISLRDPARIGVPAASSIAPPSRSSGVGIRGKGLARFTDTTKGIQASSRYVPFGRYVIHQHKLIDDMVSLRRPTGTNIADFPTRKVSPKVGHILRKIVGGGHPSYNEIGDLSDDEKAFLHKVVKMSNISDRIEIPSPTKADEDRESNEFEILKGEIMSGNDNPIMIKKFKAMLIKMSNKGAIPKGQTKDILLELIQLGY